MTWGEQNTEEEGIAQMDCAFDEYGVGTACSFLNPPHSLLGEKGARKK